MAACAFHTSSAQWGTNIENSAINWELQHWESWYSGANDGSGTADPTIKTDCYVNGAHHGARCWSWDCLAPCTSASSDVYWFGTGTPYNATLRLHGVTFESDGADDCVYDPTYDQFFWEGDYTLRDGLTEMPLIYPSSDFAPCIWNPWLASGTTWLLPNTEEFDQRMYLTWRYTAGTLDEPLDFGYVGMNTTEYDVNSNSPVSGQRSTMELQYEDWQGDASRDVFYTFRLDQASTVTIHTEHPITTFDTKIHLTDEVGSPIMHDNGGWGNTSRITAQLPAGDYGVIVEGYGPAHGRFILYVNVQPPEVQVGRETGNEGKFWLNILDDPAPSCTTPGNGFWTAMVEANDPFSSWSDEPERMFSLPGGAGNQSFQAEVRWHRETIQDAGDAVANPVWQLLIDGQVCDACIVSAEQVQLRPYEWRDDGNHYVGGYGTDRLTIIHQAGDAWDVPNGSRRFILRDLSTDQDLRFQGVMVGFTFTDVLGYFDAPQAPLYILRDPPGDRSYSSVSNTEQSCFGQTYSTSLDESENYWLNARVGVEGSTGWIVETDFEIYGQFGVDLTMGRTETTAGEYKTCLSTQSEFTTPMEGAPDDVFIGSALRYAYGMSKVLSRDVGCAVVRGGQFQIAPVEVLSSYNYTESYIRSEVIPELQDWLDQLDPGSIAYRDAANQLDVWEQTLAMNDDIKAGAPLEINRAFNGGGNGQTYSLTTSTSSARSIDMNVVLEEGLSAEFGAFLGGSGVSAGGEMRFRSEFGSGSNGSNETTNTMTYHLEDNDNSDNFNVGVRSDAVFGTYAFSLADEVTASSCPYEGGFALDQPELSVGSAGNTTLVREEVPLGTQAVFPVLVCNNSDRERIYFLKFNASTNTEGGILNVFGNALNSNDDGVQLVVPAGECLALTNLTLTQPNIGVVDFADIELYLYSLCEPEIRSSVSISAYFGDGNAPIGIAESAASAAAWFSLQPNPSGGLFELEPTADMGSTTITVFDGVGRVVKPSFKIIGKGTTVLDLQDLPSGAYHLMAERAGEQRMHKLLVQR